MIETTVTIINKLGLHARAASKLVNTAAAFAADIQVGKDGNMVDSKSIMSVMMLAASKGTDLQLRCDGSDEQLAAEAIITLIDNRFGEGE